MTIFVCAMHVVAALNEDRRAILLYYKKTSKNKIVHFEGCPHEEKMCADNRGQIATLKEARKKGYRLCKHCNSKCLEYMKRIPDIALWEYDNIICIEAFSDYIQIETYVGVWKISVYDRGKLALYHKSTQKGRKDSTSVFEKYHFQRNLECTLESCCKYISSHDKYRVKHPLQKSKSKAKKQTSQSLPQKGTARWRKREKALKKNKRRQAITNVYRLIEAL